ncbi:MAG: hypothetical protein EPN47_19380 [Acidobacteria bacterium]|nr:MAG: hypothetical protein EPN47_19380 [Acidobacteriota bacterium]
MKLGPLDIQWRNLRLAESQVNVPLERTAAAAETLPAGLPGTPIFHGFLEDFGEYNPQLEGLTAIRTYEKMRRSDAQVAATLLACELPIRAANWDVLPAGSGPLDQEIAQFVKENLFGGLEYVSPAGVKTTQCWDDVLRNALLMLAFGAAAHEEIYAVDGARVRLARLAPRLPVTFYRWITDEDGETLLALNQYGYRNSNFESVEIPADRLAVFTFNKEGANFFGRSMLRPAYMHWYIKHNLYRIDAIAGERNGLGIPTIEQGTNASREDRQAAASWVTQLAAHEKTGIALPAGWKLTLQGVQGQVRDLFNSIEHHNIEISRTALAFFMNLGQSSKSSGNRALGQEMTDFFFLAVQATADQIARTITATSVKRLVDYNWDGVGKYPTLQVSNLRSRNLDQTLTALSQLATAKVMAPYPELAQHIARELGLPQPPEGQ